MSGSKKKFEPVTSVSTLFVTKILHTELCTMWTNAISENFQIHTPHIMHPITKKSLIEWTDVISLQFTSWFSSFLLLHGKKIYVYLLEKIK